MSKQKFTLTVPADSAERVVSHGLHDFTLEPGGTVETTDARVARWLEMEHGLELEGVEDIPVSSAPTDPENEAPQQPEDADRSVRVPSEYPDDLPGRDVLIGANVPFDTVKTLTAEQLVEYKGIGPKTAAEIVAYFGGDE